MTYDKKFLYGLILVGLGGLLVPSVSEFLVALYNRSVVYPAGVDLNLGSKAMMLAVVLSVCLGVFLGVVVPTVKKLKLVVGVLAAVVFVIFAQVIPSFVPKSWCAYELTLQRCEKNNDAPVVSGNLLPSDVFAEQLYTTYFVSGTMYALAYEPNLNYDFPDLRGKTIAWHGVLSRKDITSPWNKVFTIVDPADPTQAPGEKIKYNPMGIFSENGVLYVDIANDRGAGSGEGPMLRFASKDEGKHWERVGCYYFTPEKYYFSIGHPETFDPHQLALSKDCVY